MTAPAQDGRRFLCALILGLALGVIYGFFRPLGHKRPVLADLLFLPILGYAWLYLCFAVCRADLRLSYCSGLFLGAIFWERTFGRWLYPLFYRFWHLIFSVWRKIFVKIKKIFIKIGKILKNLFAIWKKWYTIVETNRRRRWYKNGGAANG